MTPTRTAMSAVDRSWLRMESSENPMMIAAVLIFEQPMDLQRLRDILSERFLRFRRFRQRVVFQGDKAFWEDDPLFDLDNHLQRIALPGRQTKQDLEALASDLSSTPLSPHRSLWQVHYIDRYDGGCALLVRIHHCIADGISLVRVLLSLTDKTPEVRAREEERARRSAAWRTPAKAVSKIRRNYWQRLSNRGVVAWQQTRLLAQFVYSEPRYPLKLADTAGKMAMECLKLGLSPADPLTTLRKPLSGRKQVAWAEPLSLAEVKTCARALRGTVNDVLMTAAAGALHYHFTSTHEALPEGGLRVAVPFNLRPLRQPIETLGNEFGLVLVPLPVDVECPLMRFQQVQEQMNRLKGSYQAQITYSLLDLFGRGPDILERRALNLISRKASAVLTNVPGPKRPVYLAGAELKQPMFWVPQTGGIGIGMSIFTYAGTVQFGITMDKNIQADPGEFMRHFHQSFNRLRDRALQKVESDRQTTGSVDRPTKAAETPALKSTLK